jgi:hypothetical protein
MTVIATSEHLQMSLSNLDSTIVLRSFSFAKNGTQRNHQRFGASS